MSDNTILGGPSGRSSGSSATDSPSAGPVEVPGDPETAIHRQRVYALIALALQRPGEELEAALAEDAYTEQLVDSAREIDPAVEETAEAVATQVTDVETLHGQWASLFGVEEGISVSPYETTYLPGPLMTNVRKIADISGFYDAFELSIQEGKNDRRDHVRFQVEFLSHLCLRETLLRIDDDPEGVGVVVGAQRSFLEDHLGRWYWRFAEEVSAHDDGFYAALADLLAALVERDVETLGLEPEWVPDAPEVTEWNEDVFGDVGRGCGGCGMNDGENEMGSDPTRIPSSGADAPENGRDYQPSDSG